MAAPLQARGQVIGAIYVDNKIKTVMFQQDELDLLEAFATQAAVAIENARLYSQTDQALAERVDELQTMQQIDRELNLSLDFERVLGLTLDWAKRSTGAGSGWIAVLETEADKRGLHIIAGTDAGKQLQLDSPYIQQALATIEPLSLTDGEAGPWQLVAPVRREEEAVGLIGLTRTGSAFSEDASSSLARLADHAASAICNARLYDQVIAANEAKSHFVSIVTHELRIPMTSIKGYTDILNTGAVGEINEQQQQFLQIIRNNVDRMAALISDLSDISRIESGLFSLEMATVDLVECIEETMQALRPQLESRSQSCTLQDAGDLPKVRTDRARLIQILTNLISNANKYTQDGGQITIAAQVEDEFVRIDVIDNGIGMSEADQAKLFEQFFRSENNDVRNQHGWGLGLHVTKRMVEELGGEMRVRSKLGDGSTFSFTAQSVEQ